jgi:Xaa-Pro aminopeptidase
MTKIDEMREKERRARELMQREGLDAIAITNVGNFAWLTCGCSNYVGTANDIGAATAVITADAKYIVCDNIEAPRIADEEVAGRGFEFKTFAWQESARDGIISEIANGGRLGSDVPIKGARNISAALDACRQSLTEAEIERYKCLGNSAGECLSLACREIEPGMTEHEIAGMLDHFLYARGIVPTLTLIATDERISKYRHPLPTDKKLERCAMLVTGARRWGLILSATRIVHFGELPAELRRRHDAVARVDAALISATVPGARMGDVFRKAMDAYAEVGFPEEWHLHHQGGPTGYRAREFKVCEATDARMVENQAFAWNPSITGTKTEDTIVATSSGPAIISGTQDWPKIEVEIAGVTIARPDILVR